jgi:hypothetical protein
MTDRPGGDDEEVQTFVYDHEESPSAAVVSAVAAVQGEDATTLPTLYDVVDGDRLNDVLRSNDPVEGSQPIRIEFRYAGCAVAVDCHGRISVEDLGSGDAD